MNSKRALAIAGSGESAVPNENPAKGLNSAAFSQQLENVKKSGLAAYVKENLAAYYKGDLKSSEIRPRIERLVAWIAENPRLLAEFENDLRRGNIVFSNGARPAQMDRQGHFNAMLGLWLGTKYVAAEYKESQKQKVPEPVETGARGKEFKKAGNLAICAEKAGGGLGPAAVLLLPPKKDARGSALQETSLAFAASPWLEGRDRNRIAKQGPVQPQNELMKKANLDTALFAQYLMRINAITTPEVRDKISNIFLRLGAIVRDNPELAFSDFIGAFVVEMNRESGENVVTFPRKPAVRPGVKKPTKRAYVPKRTSGGPGKPPAA